MVFEHEAGEEEGGEEAAVFEPLPGSSGTKEADGDLELGG